MPELISVTTAVLVALIGFWLALRQEERRWLREKRADLYIDTCGGFRRGTVAVEDADGS